MTVERRLQPRATAWFRFGKALGDVYNDRYFDLEEGERRSWDDRRIMHHGAFGCIVASVGLAGLHAFESERARALSEAAVAAGVGLMVSDMHDQDRWWSEGTAFAPEPAPKPSMLRRALARVRGQSL
ncbi:MAG TPA: hypothetical protein VM889_04205 [Candidatus Thermoplasmatota archaeon]|nr:hypothetical protein [Candidatus Thermoplasmatota archaeon]